MTENGKDIVVVLIGSTKSVEDSTITPIPNIQQNFKELKSVLCDPSITGVPEENFIELFDLPRQDTIEKLFKACKKVTYNNMLLVYYAGHGILSSEDLQLYLTTCDSKIDEIEISGIKAYDIADRIKRSLAKRKILILDSCYSGAIMGAMSGGPESTLVAEVKREEYKGIYTMASAGETEQARFDSKNAAVPTYFTGTMVEVLREGIANNNENISIDDLYNEVRHRLERKRQIVEGLPLPIKKVFEDGNELLIARNRQYIHKPQAAGISESDLDEMVHAKLKLETDKLQGNMEATLRKVLEEQRGQTGQQAPPVNNVPVIPAPKMLRFVNLVIDSFMVAVLTILGIQNENAQNNPDNGYGSSSGGFSQAAYAILSAILLYYLCMEGFSKGRTLGKYLTGTIAVNKDGSTLGWKGAMLRTLCRMVPFEQFSGFATPWHDSWTNTTVIKKQK